MKRRISLELRVFIILGIIIISFYVFSGARFFLHFYATRMELLERQSEIFDSIQYINNYVYWNAKMPEEIPLVQPPSKKYHNSFDWEYTCHDDNWASMKLRGGFRHVDIFFNIMLEEDKLISEWNLRSYGSFGHSEKNINDITVAPLYRSQ
ncbi:MAG: hypothetical protein LBL39_07275 [Planctomycetaceae bacterium]|jgi:hypothetical protein|nr:hypothetical protein [Planctomycetaceae bacterium]